MARKPVVVAEPAFPPYCCGVCSFYHIVEKEKDGMCFGMPPFLGSDDEGFMWFRGAIVEPIEPACHLFQPKIHA